VGIELGRSGHRGVLSRLFVERLDGRVFGQFHHRLRYLYMQISDQKKAEISISSPASPACPRSWPKAPLRLRRGVPSPCPALFPTPGPLAPEAAFPKRSGGTAAFGRPRWARPPASPWPASARRCGSVWTCPVGEDRRPCWAGPDRASP